MKATGKHDGIVLSSNWCRVYHFLSFPVVAILWVRNRRLCLKAWSPYCRSAVGSLSMLVQGIFTWRKLTRINHPFLVRQRLKRRSFTSVSGVHACSVFRTSEVKFHSQLIWQEGWMHRSAEWVWGLDWIVQCFTSPPTQYRLYGRRDWGTWFETIIVKVILVSVPWTSMPSMVRSLSLLEHP